MNGITLSTAIEGYLLDAQARRLSIHTLSDYTYTLRRFQMFLMPADPLIGEISPASIRAFLAEQNGVSKKTLLNYHTGLAALWTWSIREGLVTVHVVRAIPAPKPEERAIEPFSESDVRALLAAVNRSRPYSRLGQRECTHSLDTAVRNRAIVLLLLDTGLRATELCELRIHRVDLRNRRVIVEGKGSKERIVPFSPATGRALWQYLVSRGQELANAYLFVTDSGQPLDRLYLAQVISRIGERAGVARAHPHRFRHTFAVTFLRNGGNAFALQAALGHRTLEMVQRYLKLVQADVEAAHRTASPVANWRL